jgi:thiosulfate/3-mercaptopyruvate sulfurtransferase
MFSRLAVRIFPIVAVSIFALALLLLPLLRAQNSSNPWTAAQTVQSVDLVKELADSKSAPTVLFVGFQRLYGAGHIKGAQFHGSGGGTEGLAQIKAWAASLPRTTNLVIYCGCCPMERCPNVRPVFSTLHEMGFAKVRVLILPTSFEVDWADKGLPYDKG